MHACELLLAAIKPFSALSKQLLSNISFINVLLFLRKNIIYVFKCKSTNQIKMFINCSNFISKIKINILETKYYDNHTRIFLCDQARKQPVEIHFVRTSVRYCHHIVIVNCSHFHLLLWNHFVKLNQSCLGWPSSTNSKLYQIDQPTI